MARSEDVKAPEALLAFAHNLYELNENKKYGCSLLWPKGTDLSMLEAIAVQAAVDEWGEKAKQAIKDGLIKSPFLDGDGPQALNKKTGERYKGFAGTRFIRCVSGEDFKPTVYDRNKIIILKKDGCPSGSRGYPVVNAFTWTNDQNGRGVSFGISMFQVAKVAQGEEILGGGGGPDPDKFFEKIADEGDAPESTKGGAGAGGLFG